MVDAITESFCERCGTRYQFKAPTRLTPLRRTRGLVSGLRNYIMSQDALGDAIGDAIRSEEDALATAQLDAFHESFNFCINCRQYTCLNCWNDGAGRCRTCAPIAGTDDLLTQMQAAYAGGNGGAAVPLLEYEVPLDEAEIQRRLGMETWPSADLPATNGDMPAEWPEVEPSLAEAAEPEPVAEPEPEVEPAREPMPEAPARPPLHVVAWEEDAPTALEPALEAPAAEAEPVAELPFEPEPVVELPFEPEPEVAAEALPEPPAPPPPAAEPRPARPIAPIAETILRLPPQPAPSEPTPLPPPMPQPQQPPVAEPLAAQLNDEELAARRAQLDLLGIGDPGQGPVTPEAGTVLPYRSRGAAAHPTDAARAAAAAAGQSFWEASAREVAGAASQIGLHSCDGCGLSLSANARFCRRCGTQQARSA